MKKIDLELVASVFNDKKTKSINQIRDILIDSDAISCDIECYEPLNYADRVLYSIPSGHRVTVDYNKLAAAIYNAGYRKE